MKTVPQLLFVLPFLAGLGLVQAGCGDKGKDVLQGTWVIKEVIKDGKMVAELPAGVKLVAAGDKMTFLPPEDSKGPPKQELSFKSDPTTEPKSIDTTNLDGEHKGKQFAGIYKIEGDKLTLCIQEDPGTSTRPTTFESKPGSKLTVYTLQRAKP